MRARNPKVIVADMIRAAYAHVPALTIRAQPPLSIQHMIATMTAYGLGDTLMLTDLACVSTKQGRVVHVWSRSEHFLPVFSLHPSYKVETGEFHFLNPFMVDILKLRDFYDLGNGHQLQQFRRAWGLPVDLKPSSVLSRIVDAQPNRVILHFEPSLHNVHWQRKYWHPKMREFYPASKEALEKFIRRRKDLDFIEVGKVSSDIYGATFVKTANTLELIRTIQTGSWFIGIMSGPLHVAVASGLRCIVVVNHPPAKRVVLPCLRRTGTPEEEWMYPQNVHLHQEGSTPLVPKFSLDSLEAAFSGDVYPFWMDDWLGMINDYETSRI